MNVFIVEDSAIVSDGLTAMLSDIPGVKIIGHAVDEHGAIEKIGAAHPDTVILDIGLRPGSGINVLKAIKQHSPAVKVIVLTNYTDEIYVNRCMRAGADYFLDKTFEFIRVGTILKQLIADGEMGNRFVALQ